MTRLPIALAALPMLVIAAAPTAHANAIDVLTLTTSGANTNFAITGTYTPDTPATPFSSPNTPYSLTFTLPTTPSSFAFVDSDVFGIDTTATLSSVIFTNSQVIFFADTLGGGLLVCLGVACNPDPNTPPYPALNFWNILGDPAFPGSALNPSFISGSLNFDGGQSFYGVTSPVPEPTTLILTGIGIALISLCKWRKQENQL